MAIRGPKPRMPVTAPADQPATSSKVTVLYPEVLNRPKWLSAGARRVWDDKVKRYRQRGQNITGCEDSLAQYCSIEAELIDCRRKKTVPVMAMINAHRVWAAEFFDTPASQVQRQTPGGAGNRFSNNGRRDS